MNKFQVAAVGALLVLVSFLSTAAALYPAFEAALGVLAEGPRPATPEFLTKATEAAMAAIPSQTPAILASAVLGFVAVLLISVGCLELRRRHPHALFLIPVPLLLLGALGALAGTVLFTSAAARGDAVQFRSGTGIAQLLGLISLGGWVLLGIGLILQRRAIGSGLAKGPKNLVLLTGILLILMMVPFIGPLIGLAGFVLLFLMFWSLSKGAPVASAPAQPS